jgi:uncharacterized membrane protein
MLRVVSKGLNGRRRSWLATTTCLLALGGGCADSGGKTQAIGPAGGTLEIAGASITLPSGAVPEGVTVRGATVDQVDAKLPSGLSLKGNIYAFTPHGTEFASPAEIKLPRRHSGKVFTLDDEQDSTWSEVPEVVASGDSFRFSVSHISLFAELAGTEQTTPGAAGGRADAGAGGADAGPGAGGAADTTLGGAAGDTSLPSEGGAAGAPAGCEPVPDVDTATFEELSLPGSSYVAANAVSDDGGTVVGSVYVGSETVPHAFRWQQQGGMQDLSTAEQPLHTAMHTNCDGTILFIEMALSSSGYMRWVNGQVEPPLSCDTSSQVAFVTGVSADGNVAVGTCEGSPFNAEHFGKRWLGSSATPLPIGTPRAYGTDVSADGLVFLGQSWDPSWDGAFIWTEAHGNTFIGPESAAPFKLSADGSSAVGFELDASVAFRWRAAKTTHITCGAGISSCQPTAVSADGGVIALRAGVDVSLIWTDAHGAVPFESAVVAAGADLGSWTKLSIVDMTPDARVFIGEASDADGNKAAYRLQVPRGTF